MDPGRPSGIQAAATAPAFSHQRQVLTGGYPCSPEGECPFCPVETIGSGSWQDVMNLLATRGIRPEPPNVPDVRVPARMA